MLDEPLPAPEDGILVEAEPAPTLDEPLPAPEDGILVEVEAAAMLDEPLPAPEDVMAAADRVSKQSDQRPHLPMTSVALRAGYWTGASSLLAEARTAAASARAPSFQEWTNCSTNDVRDGNDMRNVLLTLLGREYS